MPLHNWIIDYRSDHRANMYRVTRTVASHRSQYQDILIVDTEDFGRALFLDGVPQSSALDEHVYHESLVHPGLIASVNPQTVFIAGGGEGAVLREVLKHNTVKRVVMVDIDEDLVRLSREHLLEWHRGGFADPRVQLIHQDARGFLAGSKELFDSIIVDMPDPLESSPAALLFTQEFFAIAASRLTSHGTFAMQAESTNVGEEAAFVSIIKTLRNCFEVVLPYQIPIPFYGLAWGFVLAGKNHMEARLNSNLLATTLNERQCLDLKHYDEETHLHMFALPKHLRLGLSDPSKGTIITDGQKLVVY